MSVPSSFALADFSQEDLVGQVGIVEDDNVIVRIMKFTMMIMMITIMRIMMSMIMMMAMRNILIFH